MIKIKKIAESLSKDNIKEKLENLFIEISDMGYNIDVEIVPKRSKLIYKISIPYKSSVSGYLNSHNPADTEFSTFLNVKMRDYSMSLIFLKIISKIYKKITIGSVDLYSTSLDDIKIACYINIDEKLNDL